MSQRVDKDSLPLDQPRRTPGHPTKSHIVKTKVGGKEKIIRFGEQGASTAGKPKAGESDRMKQKRASFKARHAKNIAKGKSSPAYWANKVKWAEGGEVKLARGGSAAMALLEQMRRSGNSPEFNAVEASLREQRMRPRRSVVPPPQQRQAVPQAEELPLPPVPPAMRPDENPPPEAPRSARAFDEGNPFVATAIQMAERYNLPRDVFLSLVRQESNFNPAAVSPRGAIGLGQLMPGTARELGVDPNDPVQNLEGSARYLRRMLDRFGDMPLALAAYNAGPTRVALSGNMIPNIRETQNYVQTIMRNAGASGFAEGGLAELDSKYADGNVVTAYDPDAVEARIRSVAEPEGYAEGGRVRRTLRDELRDIEAEVRGERPASLGVTVARGMGEGGGGFAGAIRRAPRGKPEFFSLNQGPDGVPEVTRISPERMRELQALDDAMVAEANASRPALNVRQQDVDRLAADLANNPMRAADEMAALREAEALRRAGATLADDLADNPFASRPEVMRVYHAGAEFDTPWPGLFTNPDRAMVESFQQNMRAPRLHELEISPRNIAKEEDIYDVARRYNVYMPDTPAAQYLEQGENAIFGEAADIVAELRRRGFDSARLNDGMGPEPSIVVLDPGIVRRYAEGGEVTAPKRETISGQPHELAYITPEEALLLRLRGGSGRMTHYGVRAYDDGGGDGNGGDGGGGGSDSGGGNDSGGGTSDGEGAGGGTSASDAAAAAAAANTDADAGPGGVNSGPDATSSVSDAIGAGFGPESSGYGNQGGPGPNASVGMSAADPEGTSQAANMSTATAAQNAGLGFGIADTGGVAPTGFSAAPGLAETAAAFGRGDISLGQALGFGLQAGLSPPGVQIGTVTDQLGLQSPAASINPAGLGAGLAGTALGLATGIPGLGLATGALGTAIGNAFGVAPSIVSYSPGEGPTSNVDSGGSDATSLTDIATSAAAPAFPAPAQTAPTAEQMSSPYRAWDWAQIQRDAAANNMSLDAYVASRGLGYLSNYAPRIMSRGGLADLEQKYAEGGRVSVAQYNPAAVDALVKQIEAEYV